MQLIFICRFNTLSVTFVTYYYIILSFPVLNPYEFVLQVNIETLHKLDCPDCPDQ